MSVIQANVDFGGTSRVGQSVHVYPHGTTTPADLFEADGTTPIANPLEVLGNGHVVFYAAAGTYDLVGPDLTRIVVLAEPLTPLSGVDSQAFLVDTTSVTDGSRTTLSFTLSGSQGSANVGADSGHITFAADGVYLITLEPLSVVAANAGDTPTVWPWVSVNDAASNLYGQLYLDGSGASWPFPQTVPCSVIVPPLRVSAGDWIEFAVEGSTDFKGCRAYVVRVA